MNYEYHIINEAYEVVDVCKYEEDALAFVEEHRQFSYVKELKPSIQNLERLFLL